MIFFIVLESSTHTISIPPYRAAQQYIRDLKAQNQELHNKGFVRPGASLWGSPSLVVKKKEGGRGSMNLS